MRRLSPTVEPNSQLGQVFIGITTNRRLLVNSSGRALIKTGQSCGIVGAADRDALWHRRHRGAGGAARSASRPGGSRSD